MLTQVGKQRVKRIIFQDAKKWRRWLRLNHHRREEVWLVLPKKAAGRDSYRVYYNQALEEALCYGWIDSRVRKLDANRCLVRFTPSEEPRTGPDTISAELWN